MYICLKQLLDLIVLVKCDLLKEGIVWLIFLTKKVTFIHMSI